MVGETSPVTYYCTGGNLVRYEGYDVLATQPVPPSTGTTAVVIADIVQSCAFTYDPGTAPDDWQLPIG